MDKFNVNDLINGIGAIAEMGAILRDALMKNGFTRQEAIVIVTESIAAAFTKEKQ